ncbi:MAG TPA: hypothetical protein VGG99_26085 [Acetobacteraceae bacterium]
MPVDLAAIRRRYKPDRQLSQLSVRPESELVPVSSATGTTRILLDTTVYLHEVAGRLPNVATGLLDRALRFHSSLCIAEVVIGLSKLHPDSANFVPAWAYFERLFEAVPASRVLHASPATLAEAGAVCGILARVQNFARDQLNVFFNDAVVYLTAARMGVPVLTANRADFDLIQQVVGHGNFIYYVAM